MDTQSQLKTREKNPRVKIVWGGYQCRSGKVYWAYVARDLGKLGPEGFGKALFEPPRRFIVTDKEHSAYGLEPEPHPKPICHRWIAEQGFVLTEIREVVTLEKRKSV